MNEMVKIQHQQWARDLDDQRRSGLTQREWCRIHGISIHTFEYRCRIVRQTMENLLSESNLPFSLQNWTFSRVFQKHPVFGFRLREFL